MRGKVVVIIVVYVDDLLVASETKRDDEQATKDLRPCFPIKDLEGRILSWMPHHAGSRRGNAETRPTPLRVDRGFEI